VAKASSAGARASYAEIDTLSGHDAFLKDWKDLKEAIQPFTTQKADG
jgi:homoserine O-acetyltransferase/O-succinyltransferase